MANTHCGVHLKLKKKKKIKDKTMKNFCDDTDGDLCTDLCGLSHRHVSEAFQGDACFMFLKLLVVCCSFFPLV